MEISKEILDWLLEGDVSIQYQTHRDLLNEDRSDLRDRIATEGWGAHFLSKRREDGHWGRGYYMPKWTSTHYTLFDLRNLEISPEQPEIRNTLRMVLADEKSADAGVKGYRAILKYDLCITGMFLRCAAYFKMPEDDLAPLIDFILKEHMPDGGFNCRSTRSTVVHSSLHTTISVLEGIRELILRGYRYRIPELQEAELASQEFILMHRLFRSDHTGDIIDKRMLMLSYPSRWKYDILRSLEYFRQAKAAYDPRMGDAFEVISKKQRKDGTWPVQAKHSGEVHFDMEKTGGPSRWNTLRVLRVSRELGVIQ